MSTHPDRFRLRPARCWKLALVLGNGCLLGACAHRPQPMASPIKTLARYRDALDRDDPKAAYALLTKATQQGLPYEQFAQQWQQTQVERSTQAAQLRQLETGGAAPLGDDGPVKARAVVTLPQGVQLVLEPLAAERVLMGKASSWRILNPDLQGIRAQTPRAVLQLLLTAAEQRNYPALLGLLTKAERQSLEAELAERIERLRTNLTQAPALTVPEVIGDRTRIQYDPRFFIDLKREPEGWRIADFN